MESRTSRHSIREFVHSLEPGTRVVWIANGGTGTIQHDKTILWDDGHHMTHKQMNDTHALLIHSETERAHLQKLLANRVKCIKGGCKLVSWDAAGCKEGLPKRICPMAILSEPEIQSVIGRRKHQMRSVRAHAS
jgi:hypothetical protein